MKVLYTSLVICLLTLCSIHPVSALSGQFNVSDDWYSIEPLFHSQSAHSQQPLSEQLSYEDGAILFQLASEQLERLLNVELDETFEMDIPLLNGKFVRYQLVHSAVMSPELSSKYPRIKTFIGYQVNAPQNRGVFDVSDLGFHGSIKHGDATIYIDPKTRGNPYQYTSLNRDNQTISHNKQLKRSAIVDTVVRKSIKRGVLSKTALKTAKRQSQTIRTLRLAIATTGEYSEFHGGTKAQVLAALVTMVNRINQIYREDLGVQFELVGNNDDVIFLNSATDPFTNTDEDLEAIQVEMDERIGTDDYDIGHIVTTGGGGIASLGAVCTSSKAEGLTGSEFPINDGFYIDYVAHEIGHQLGAEHIFNGESGGCEDNRIDNSAYEPASGNTIMGYAGLCGLQDIARSTDAHFHIHSIDQMEQTLNQAGSCGVSRQLSAAIPTANAGPDHHIPAKTPFELRAYNTDNNDVAANYSWYQMDLGEKTNSVRGDNTDDGFRPLFRSFLPRLEKVRSFPQALDVLGNKVSYGETFPTTTRELNFRLVVRDNQGNLSDDRVKLNVVEVEQGFSVQQPNMSSVNEMNVNWHTADTELSPVSCQQLDILLSSDGGITFDKALLLNTQNDGQEMITVSNIQTTQARIKLVCSNNVFYAVNPTNFDIDAPQVEGLSHQDYVVNSHSTEPSDTSTSVVTSTEGDSDSDETVEQKSSNSGSAFGLCVFIIFAIRRFIGFPR